MLTAPPPAPPPPSNAARCTELRICTNRTCRKQGSPRLAEAARVLASGLTVSKVGCLGQCGAGPNCVLLPSGLAVSHVDSLDTLAALLNRQCGLDAAETASRLASFRAALRAGTVG